MVGDKDQQLLKGSQWPFHDSRTGSSIAVIALLESTVALEIISITASEAKLLHNDTHL